MCRNLYLGEARERHKCAHHKQGQILGIRCAQQASERRRYRPTDGRMDRWTDTPIYRDATAQKKEEKNYQITFERLSKMREEKNDRT